MNNRIYLLVKIEMLVKGNVEVSVEVRQKWEEIKLCDESGTVDNNLGFFCV